MGNPLRSIRVRLTLWHVVALALLLAVFSAGVYFALRRELQENLDNSLESRVAALLPLVEVSGGTPRLPPNVAPVELDEDGDDEAPEPDDEVFVRLFDDTGALVLDTSETDEVGQLATADVAVALEGSPQWLTLSSEDEDEDFRVLIAPVVRDGEVVGALAVGESDEDVAEALDALLTIVGVALPLSLLAAGGVGIFLSSRALAPIDRITRAARDISAADLGQRLDMDLPDDELGRLARTFDDMLERLDDAFRRQRQFTADASHELRTPLSIMRGQIEVALARPRGPDEYVETLEAAAEQTERLIALTTSLLTLARADAGRIPLQPEPLEVRALVELTVEQARHLAEERGVALAVAGPEAWIEADTTLLIQLLLNLLDNAVKHTPSGGQVRVTWTTEADDLQLKVTDTGEGIPSEHLPHIFDRFYRVDVARNRSEGGAGIGLAIARWIAEAHGGTISATSRPGAGSTFLVTLPGTDAS